MDCSNLSSDLAGYQVFLFVSVVLNIMLAAACAYNRAAWNELRGLHKKQDEKMGPRQP